MADYDSMAMILAGGASPALSALTERRSESALPFGGKFRIIDFTLSNCVNSEIFNVAVLTQYQPRSLNEHIGIGKPWDLDRSTGGVRLLQPYQSRPGERTAWQEGTADAVRFHMDYLRDQDEDLVLILAGDHIYKMDYRPMVDFHVQRRADVTIAVRSVNPYEMRRYGMVTADPDGRVTQFEEKPKRTRSTLASMGIYVFTRELLVDWLSLGPGRSHRDFGREVIPGMIDGNKRLYAYNYLGYWADVGTVQAYWEANMALLAETPALDLYDPEWIIHTRSEERPPVFLSPEAEADGNLLSDGCIIEGNVERSLISPGVHVAPDALVRDSIILNDAEIAPGVVIDRAIIDKEVRVGQNAHVGAGDDNTPNRDMPNLLNTGLTLIGKGAELTEGLVVGRNCVIHPYTTGRAFKNGEMVSGSTV